MLTNDKVRLALSDTEHELCRAEVSIFDPDFPFVNQRQHLSQQGTLLRMTILTRDNVRHQIELGIVHHQRLTRQRCGRLSTQHLQAPLGGSQMMAIDNLHTVSRDWRSQFGP
jgi:hypothetical protein